VEDKKRGMEDFYCIVPGDIRAIDACVKNVWSQSKFPQSHQYAEQNDCGLDEG
jgi:hypothetical protein